MKICLRFILILLPCLPLHAQNSGMAKMINAYCDSIDRAVTDTVTRVCGGGLFTLTFTMHGHDIVKIHEHYADRHIESTQCYYFRDGACMAVRGDMQIRPDDVRYNMLELQKIYFRDNKVALYFYSEQQFDPSAYPGSDGAGLSRLRNRARFEPRMMETNLEKNLYKAIEDYRKAAALDRSDPFLQQLHPPFI